MNQSSVIKKGTFEDIELLKKSLGDMLYKHIILSKGEEFGFDITLSSGES